MGKSGEKSNQPTMPRVKRPKVSKPVCSICLELPLSPVVMPCKCRLAMCLECWRRNFELYTSECPTCKTRISAGVIRRGGGLKGFIDKDLESLIASKWPTELARRQRSCFNSTECGQLGEDEEEEEEELDEETTRKERAVPLGQGNLKKDLEEMEALRQQQRQQAEARNEELLRAFLKEHEPDLVQRVEQEKADEELARRLEEEEGQRLRVERNRQALEAISSNQRTTHGDETEEDDETGKSAQDTKQTRPKDCVRVQDCVAETFPTSERKRRRRRCDNESPRVIQASSSSSSSSARHVIRKTSKSSRNSSRSVQPSAVVVDLSQEL